MAYTDIVFILIILVAVAWLAFELYLRSDFDISVIYKK